MAFKYVAAPPTRGWTRCGTSRRRRGRGCPAYAGMDPHPGPRSRLAPGLPRLRGDGPRKNRQLSPPCGAAPPTRGWTPPRLLSATSCGGCPAYAGMDPLKKRIGIPSRRLPRLRGDGPYSALACKPALAAAPPTRGWTFARPSQLARRPGCPAYAGMDPSAADVEMDRVGLPRLRGDGPKSSFSRYKRPMAAPPTRGWTVLGWSRRNHGEGCPAYAGMDPAVGDWRGRPTRLPRLRGDGPKKPRILLSLAKAAPPTRGWTPKRNDFSFAQGGCPAYAGMDPTCA